MSNISRRILPVLLLIVLLFSSLTSCQGLFDISGNQTQQPTLTATSTPTATTTATATATVKPTTTATATQDVKPTPTYIPTVSPTVTALPTSTSDTLILIYQDDFSNSGNWSISSSNEVTRSISSGEYCFSVNSTGSIFASGTGAITEQSNFAVSIDARIVPANSDASCGVEFRRNENGDFYLFQITGNGYSLNKLISGKWVTIIKNTKSDYIKTDGTANQFQIACLGKKIEISVNKQNIDTVEDSSLTSGDIYITASGTGAKIYYDNFKLYHFSNSYIMSADPTIPVITTTKLAAGEVGVKYRATLSVSGGTAPYTWSLIDGKLPPGLSLNTSNGEISGIPDIEDEYNFTVQVTSSTGTSTLQTSIKITSLSILTLHLPDGIINKNYSFTLEAAGGDSHYVWSLASGTLPEGLTLNSAAGIISGIPTKDGGPVTAFIKLTDGAGASVIKGLSLNIQRADYQEIDQRALNVPSSALTSVNTLVAYLIAPCKNDMEKARVIYRWIAENIKYDYATIGKEGAARPSQSAEAVFARRDGVCEGYSKLFKQMADYAELQSVFIVGWGKTDYGYLKTNDDKEDHAWNAVQINGKWLLVDTTWGAGYVNDEIFTKELEDFWFLTPPERYIYTHYPTDEQYQFLTPVYAESAVAAHPLIKPSFFIYGLGLGDNDYSWYTVKNYMYFTVPTPPDVVLSASIKMNGQEVAGNYTLCQRKDSAHYEVHAFFPTAGEYELYIYARWLNEDSGHGALIYKIDTSQNSTTNFPEVYSTFSDNGAYLYSSSLWIPGTLQSGVSYNYEISVPGAREVVFITNAGSDAAEFHPLSKNGQTFTGRIDIVPGKMKISAQFPGEDSYWSLLEYTGR